MPVHAVAWRDAGVMERGVALRNGNFVEERPATGGLRDAAQEIEVPIPYESEIGLAGARAGCAALAERLEHGAIFVIDYGFPRPSTTTRSARWAR